MGLLMMYIGGQSMVQRFASNLFRCTRQAVLDIHQNTFSHRPRHPLLLLNEIYINALRGGRVETLGPPKYLSRLDLFSWTDKREDTHPILAVLT